MVQYQLQGNGPDAEYEKEQHGSGLALQGAPGLTVRLGISGAKNAALPLQASCLMTDRPVQLDNMLALADTRLMADLLDHLGKQTSQNGDSWQMSGKVGSGLMHPMSLYRKCGRQFW